MVFKIVETEQDITHHGIKGQKWGVRRYQNANGSLTSAGKKRYRSQLAAKDTELRRISQAKASEEAKLKQMESMKSYSGFRKATISSTFGDDSKDEKTLNRNLRRDYEVEDVDDFFNKYYGQSLKSMHRNFLSSYDQERKSGQALIDRYTEQYNKISDIDVVGKSTRRVRKEIKNAKRT